MTTVRISYESGEPAGSVVAAAEIVNAKLEVVAQLPVLAGAGPHVLGDFDGPLELLHVRSEPSGKDMLLEVYLHEP